MHHLDKVRVGMIGLLEVAEATMAVAQDTLMAVMEAHHI